MGCDQVRLRHPCVSLLQSNRARTRIPCPTASHTLGWDGDSSNSWWNLRAKNWGQVWLKSKMPSQLQSADSQNIKLFLKPLTKSGSLCAGVKITLFLFWKPCLHKPLFPSTQTTTPYLIFPSVSQSVKTVVTLALGSWLCVPWSSWSSQKPLQLQSSLCFPKDTLLTGRLNPPRSSGYRGAEWSKNVWVKE